MGLLESLAIWLVDWLRGWQQGRRNVRVLVHSAFFRGKTIPYYFVNVTNLSRDREIEVTHAWFDVEPPLHVLRAERPLPVRLRCDESWETWIELASSCTRRIQRLSRAYDSLPGRSSNPDRTQTCRWKDSCRALAEITASRRPRRTYLVTCSSGHHTTPQIGSAGFPFREQVIRLERPRFWFHAQRSR